MTRPRTDAEAGRDLRPDAPTLDDLRRAHDWRHEERAEGRYIVDVCAQCGREESGESTGRSPDCAVREIPSRLTAKRHGLLPETEGVRPDSMLGTPSAEP